MLAEAEAGDRLAVARRLDALTGIPILNITDEAKVLASRLIAENALPDNAQSDALHIATASVHGMDYLLTWNCRHIDNAETKPLVRSICAVAGYPCPEICTPFELMAGEEENV